MRRQALVEMAHSTQHAVADSGDEASPHHGWYTAVAWEFDQLSNGHRNLLDCLGIEVAGPWYEKEGTA